jgi:hypothetical protein
MVFIGGGEGSLMVGGLREIIQRQALAVRMVNGQVAVCNWYTGGRAERGDVFGGCWTACRESSDMHGRIARLLEARPVPQKAGSQS